MADLDNITQFSGITITSDQNTGTNNPNATFALPCLTDKQKDEIANVTTYEAGGKQVKVKPGTMIYNIDRACIQIFIKGVWQNLFAVATTATGVGLTSGLPFVFPVGKKADVEKTANQVNGFTYFDVTEGVEIDKTIRTFDDGKWGTVTVLPDEE
jgi:hypothetical protein